MTEQMTEQPLGEQVDDTEDCPPDASTAQIPQPGFSRTASAAVKKSSFQLKGGLVDAYFIRRSDVLWVTFDNLGSVGATVPAQPWLQMRAAHAGASILGIVAHRKDWYRNPDTAALITSLRHAGLFAKFKRVVFIGASMGGFAALTYSALVPGSVVLAFSPQSTLAKSIVPFERRYKYGLRKWDWTTPEHLDAANAVTTAAKIWLVYDPFVPEDHAHARRISGPNVQHLHFDHTGHRAIRQLKDFGVLSQLIEGIANDALDVTALFRAARARRTNLTWQRNLTAEAERRKHVPLLLAASHAMSALDPGSRFPIRLRRRLSAPNQPTTVGALLLPPTHGPFKHEIVTLEAALVVPERDHDAKLASGVLAADGSYCALSKAWIRAGKATPAPVIAPQEEIVDLPGTHLFGGHFRGHFGHFLVESTARLWALGHLDRPIDSLLYLPYRGSVGPIERAISGHDAFFKLLGLTVPVQTFGSVLRVERLIVPELGFGWSELYAGSPAYRAFMCGKLNAAVAAHGGTRLYISRALLPAQRGGILGEAFIEENLARAGYDIFHPERHSVAEQLARYKAADEIVALDGSALHLSAYVLKPGTKVTMILRRSKANVADYNLQFQSFCGITPQVIDVIKRDWVADDSTRIDFRSVGELDFYALFQRLKSLGAVPAAFIPNLPVQSEIDKMLESISERRKSEFRVLKPGERHFAEATD
jgi:hypothetical protein